MDINPSSRLPPDALGPIAGKQQIGAPKQTSLENKVSATGSSVIAKTPPADAAKQLPVAKPAAQSSDAVKTQVRIVEQFIGRSSELVINGKKVDLKKLNKNIKQITGFLNKTETPQLTGSQRKTLESYVQKLNEQLQQGGIFRRLSGKQGLIKNAIKQLDSILQKAETRDPYSAMPQSVDETARHTGYDTVPEETNHDDTVPEQIYGPIKFDTSSIDETASEQTEYGTLKPDDDFSGYGNIPVGDVEEDQVSTASGYGNIPQEPLSGYGNIPQRPVSEYGRLIPDDELPPISASSGYGSVPKDTAAMGYGGLPTESEWEVQVNKLIAELEAEKNPGEK